MGQARDADELVAVDLPPEVGSCMPCAMWRLYDRAGATASRAALIERHRGHPRVVSSPNGLPHLWRVVSGRSPVPPGTVLELRSSWHQSLDDVACPFEAVDWLFASRDPAGPRMFWAFSSLDWSAHDPRRDTAEWRRRLFPACVEPIEEPER